MNTQDGKRPVAFAADHAGYALKEHLRGRLADTGVPVLDLGTDSDKSVDYPDFGNGLADALLRGDAWRGVAICGTGLGISMAANRHPGIRCAPSHDVDAVKLARAHNDANVLALGARFIDSETAWKCLQAFLGTEFEAGRHATRVRKLG